MSSCLKNKCEQTTEMESMHSAGFLLHRVRWVTHHSCISQMIHSLGKHTHTHTHAVALLIGQLTKWCWKWIASRNQPGVCIWEKQPTCAALVCVVGEVVCCALIAALSSEWFLLSKGRPGFRNWLLFFLTWYHVYRSDCTAPTSSARKT